MTDRYENIRRALAMGPTPGPFSAVRSYSHGNQELIIRLTCNDEYGITENYCTVHNRLGDERKTEANAAYIAACDPDTIRELVAERDQLAASLEAAQMGLRYAVRVWVLSDEITWSEAEIDKVVESIIGDAKRRLAMTDRQSTHAADCWGWGPKHYECAVRAIERLAARLGAETSNARAEAEYEYEVWQDGVLQAGGREADYASAQSEARHYAAMYTPDGPVEVRIYEKRLLSTTQQPAVVGEESSKGVDVARPKRRRYDSYGSLSEYGIFPECDAQPLEAAQPPSQESAMDKPIPETVVEAVARAICVACEENPDRQGDARGNEFRWQDYRDMALAAISSFTAAQQPADDEVVFIDGVGAGRSSIKSCHNGVQWIRVGDRVYWPLSDSDAKRLQSACCGNGSFDGPATPAVKGEQQ